MADYSAVMDAEEVRATLAGALSANKANATELSRKMGRSPGYISDFLRRKKDRLDGGAASFLEEMLALPKGSLLVSATRLGAGAGAVSKSEGFRPPPEFFGEVDLPVYAAVEGGPGEMVVSTDAIDHVLRPWFLRSVKDGYAVVVTGESMVPVYEPGDMVIVNPRLPAIRGKNAIFVADEEQGGFTATVKRLEKSTATEWHVRQWNPPEGGKQELTLPKKRWPKALRIVGRYEGG